MKIYVRKIILLTILLLILGTIVNFLFVWGICFDQMGGFKSAGSPDYLEDQFPGNEDSGIGIKDGGRFLGIPWILMFYPLDNPPYDINIHLYDVNLRMKKMAIETILIRFDDGEEVQNNIACIKEFSVSTNSTWVGSQLTTYPVTRMDTSLSSVVTKSKSCTIKISGYLIDADDNKIPFETNNYFDYEPPYWRVYRALGSF
jgi:hypothetical protein